MNVHLQNFSPWKFSPILVILLQLLKMSAGETNNSIAMSNEEVLDRLSTFAKSSDPDEQFRGITLTRQWLSMPNKTNFEKDFVKRGFLPILINGLQSKNTKMQYECAVVLGLLIEDELVVDDVVKSGCIPLLVDLVASTDNEVANAASLTLAQTLSLNTKYRDQCLAAGVAKAYAKRLDLNASLNLLRHITYGTRHIFVDKASPPSLEVSKTLLPGLVKLVGHKDAEVLRETLLSIAYITDNEEARKAVTKTGVAKKAILLLDHQDPEVQHAAIDILGNIASGTYEYTQYILDIGTMPLMEKFLNHPNKKLNKEACWFLTNFLAGSEEQIQEVFDAGYIPLIIKHLQSDDFPTQHKAAKCMLNVAAYGNGKQLSTIIDENVIPALSAYMKVVENKDDSKVIELGLQALQKIIFNAQQRKHYIHKQLIQSGGIDILNRLTKHKAEPVKMGSMDIIISLAADESTENYHHFSGHDEI